MNAKRSFFSSVKGWSNILFIMFVLCAGLKVMAQEVSQQRGVQVVSPEIGADNSVIFRVYAPDAGTITLSGSWMGQGETGSLPKIVKGYGH
jgi:hypothetical protein